MEENPFTNREITAMFEKQNSMLQDMAKTLSRIEENTENTQRRVETLEKRNENRDGASGVWRGIGITIAMVVLGYMSWIGLQIFHITNTLSQYEEITTP